MLKFAGILVVAMLIACSPLRAIAQTTPTGASSTHPATHAHRPTGSYRSEMRRRNNLSRERARAGAEHVRKMHAQ
jgi:hypothetical protein